MPLPPSLHDRLVLITGAYGGLGRAVSLACARAGATVVIFGRVVRRLEALYDEIVAAGGPEPVIHPLDLLTADTTAFENAASALHAQFGRLDGLVHIAATVGSLSPIEHQSLDNWLSTWRVNTAAAAALTRACSPLLRASPNAAVVFTLDSRGQDPRAYWGAYAASKAGLAALFAEVADEWGNLPNVRVDAVVPGPINSPIRRRTHPGEDPAQHPAPDALGPLYVELLSPRPKSESGRIVEARQWLARAQGAEPSPM